jgi:hypothetical protein
MVLVATCGCEHSSLTGTIALSMGTLEGVHLEVTMTEGLSPLSSQPQLGETCSVFICSCLTFPQF